MPLPGVLLAAAQAETDRKVDELNRKVDSLAEAQEEARENINAILDWTDRVSSISELHIPRI